MTRRNYRVRGTHYSRSLGGSQAIAEYTTLDAAQTRARRAVGEARRSFGISCAWVETARGAVIPTDEPSVFYFEGFEPPPGLWPGKLRECVGRHDVDASDHDL